MQSSLPGMNPNLQDRSGWAGRYTRLIPRLRVELTRHLGPVFVTDAAWVAAQVERRLVACSRDRIWR